MPVRRFSRVALIALAPIAAGCRSMPSAPAITSPRSADTLSLSDRTAIVDGMDALVRHEFAHWQPLGRQSYDSMVTIFRDRAAHSASRWDFDLAALAFTAGLRNGHTTFYDPWLQSRSHARWFALTPTDQGWVVRSSRVDGLARGDVVVSIDGQPVDSVYARHRPYLAASGERIRKRNWTSSADYLFPESVTVATAAGATVRIGRGTPTSSASDAPIVIPHRWIARDSIAYVRVARFSPNGYADSALAIIRRDYANAPTLILDVRDNGGGNTPSALISYLMNGAKVRHMKIESSRIFTDRLMFLEPLSRLHFGSRSAGFEGKLVILANAGCASACEDLVAPFADNHRATVVGNTTWGSSGQPHFMIFGNGMSFRVSARRYRMASGDAFEGIGIPPHVYVAEDYRPGVDALLARGIEVARSLGTRD